LIWLVVELIDSNCLHGEFHVSSWAPYSSFWSGQRPFVTLSVIGSFVSVWGSRHSPKLTLRMRRSRGGGKRRDPLLRKVLPGRMLFSMDMSGCFCFPGCGLSRTENCFGSLKCWRSCSHPCGLGLRLEEVRSEWVAAVSLPKRKPPPEPFPFIRSNGLH